MAVAHVGIPPASVKTSPSVPTAVLTNFLDVFAYITPLFIKVESTNPLAPAVNLVALSSAVLGLMVKFVVVLILLPIRKAMFLSVVVTVSDVFAIEPALPLVSWLPPMSTPGN